MDKGLGFRKKRDCTIHVAKTKALISCAVTAQLICVFVFAYSKSRVSHNEAQIQGASDEYPIFAPNGYPQFFILCEYEKTKDSFLTISRIPSRHA